MPKLPQGEAKALQRIQLMQPCAHDHDHEHDHDEQLGPLIDRQAVKPHQVEGLHEPTAAESFGSRVPSHSHIQITVRVRVKKGSCFCAEGEGGFPESVLSLVQTTTHHQPHTRRGCVCLRLISSAVSEEGSYQLTAHEAFGDSARAFQRDSSVRNAASPANVHGIIRSCSVGHVSEQKRRNLASISRQNSAH